MQKPDVAGMFNAAAADFERVTPLVWGPAAHALVHQLRLTPGERVLDVCAGTGASALAAAMATGPGGSVHAVDLAGDLLDVGRALAKERGLENIAFEAADVTTWPGRPGAYDAVACSYGVFFLPEMDASTERLLDFLRPGGRFGLTLWRHGALEDYATTFGEVLQKVTGTEGPVRRPFWEDNIVRINTPETLHAWLADRGLSDITVTVLSNYIPLTERFAWDLVRGSGMRGALISLEPATVSELKRAFLDELECRGLRTLDATTLVATGSSGAVE